MKFQVKVRVNPLKMQEFGIKLQKNELDRSLIRGDTHCLKDDPAVGYSIWEANSKESFDRVFNTWKPYYLDTEVRKVITPNEAFQALLYKK